jgi:hypothetical protein
LRTPSDFSEGIFEASAESLDVVAAFPIEERRALKLFLHPTMLLFLAFCAGEIFVMLFLNGGL